MVTKSRKYLVIGALALAMLFCGPVTSKLLAQVSFYGSFPLPHGNIVVSNGYPSYGYPNYGYAAPGYAPYGYPYRPYRVVRVFVPVPYPHWVFRRVYYAPHYGYRSPYYGYRPY